MKNMITLNEIFTSNLVFAANKPIRIFGEGKGKIKVSFLGKEKSIVSKGDNWLIEFPAMDYGGPYEMYIDLDNKHIVLEDIYIGEVYLCAGQSNMQFKLGEGFYDENRINDNKYLRMFSTDTVENLEYYKRKDGWVKAKKDYVKYWSYIGYLLGETIQRKKGIAVGIITCYQGASCIESWISEKSLKNLPLQLDVKYKHPDHTSPLYCSWNGDSVLYNKVFKQIIPFSFTEVVWYQGESNTVKEEGKIYLEELISLIKCWREELMDEDLKFIVVQISDLINCYDKEGWKLIQQAQMEVSKRLKGVRTVISKDICDNKDIHPKDKIKLVDRIVKEIESF